VENAHDCAFFALGVILLCGAMKYYRIIGEFRLGFCRSNLRSRIQVNVYDLLSGSSQERAKQAIEFVRQLEDSEVLLEPQDDKQIISPADKAQVRKLVKAIKDLHFNQAQGI